ncbi:hypothetical protein BGZ76_004117 [Entomortierella beljakovae]|nr:hypothetical protein BGZ76_004117 [Entomortierella beljakovae]
MPLNAGLGHLRECKVPASPLNNENLIKHTEYHRKLDQKRDFVKEFLDSLISTAKPESNPQPAVTSSNTEVRPSNNTKPRPRQQHRQQSQAQKSKQPCSAQESGQIHAAKQSPSGQLSTRKRKASGSRPNSKPKFNIKSPTAETETGPKPLTLEIDVENLEIRDSQSDSGLSTKDKKVRHKLSKGSRTTKKYQVQEDQHVLAQRTGPKENSRWAREPDASLHEKKDDRDDNKHNMKIERKFESEISSQSNSHMKSAIPKRKTAKSDSNKPRKILTQGSLIINQFVSPTIAKERITGYSKKEKHLKGPTFTKCVGEEFSEERFLNNRVVSEQPKLTDQQNDLVTSTYFDPPENVSQAQEHMEGRLSYKEDEGMSLGSKSKRSAHTENYANTFRVKLSSPVITEKESNAWSSMASLQQRFSQGVSELQANSGFIPTKNMQRDNSEVLFDDLPHEYYECHQSIAPTIIPDSLYNPMNNFGVEIPSYSTEDQNCYEAQNNFYHISHGQYSLAMNSQKPKYSYPQECPAYFPMYYSGSPTVVTDGQQEENWYGQNIANYEYPNIEYIETPQYREDELEHLHSLPDITIGLTSLLPRMKEQVLEQAPKKMKYNKIWSDFGFWMVSYLNILSSLFIDSKHIQFGVLSPQEIVSVSEFEVTQRDLYTVQDRQPVKYGMLDLRLTCSRVLLSEKDRRTYLKRLRAPNLENLTRKNVVKAVNDKCKKVVHCSYCEATNGTVKKVGALRIVHEKYRAKKVAEEYEIFKNSFNNAIEAAPEMKAHIPKAQEDMNPLRVLNLFKAISDEDCELLGMNPDNGRPEMYLWQNIAVPPVCIRPSVQQDGASNEDDITVKLTEVIFTNAHMQAGLNQGIAIHNLMEQWDFLQLSVAMYINSELPGISNLQPGKPVRGFCQRLKGKQGRFRGNLSGKRVDFSGRTVISPDPNLRIDQVAVPELVAKNLTYPERVTTHNIDRLRKAISNGTEVHPGANYVTLGSNNMKKSLKFGNRTQIAAEIQVGDVVERHLNDGDVVLFNRQPSLHKLSIMAHYAKIRPWRTFRFNECVCNPYNADFDGDEMNLHVPQTEEARTEAIELMGVKNNLVTPRNGTPLIAAIQDFITASYLITQKDLFYDRSQFVQICSYLGDAELKIDIPPPAILKPAQRWTGKQIISVLLKPNKQSKVLVNLETKTRSYDKVKRPIMDMCRNDGYLVIYNSEIMCGALDKSIVGDGNKSSLFYIVMRDYGSIEAANCMNRLAKLCARWLGTVGFSIGINDVQPGDVLASKKDQLVRSAYSKCDDLIHRSTTGQLENQPGCDVEQTLEALISGELSKVRDSVGDICLTELNKYNSPLIMATCGSKGSKINVSQMVACVGQQIISGKRIPNGFQDRSLPHFLKNSKVPPAKGFVRNSFYSGLTPTEFFFHAVSGREGLVDTAVKTAETGYMQRRLMKAFEDLTTHYDLSVRNSVGSIIQFTYGSDGLDPAVLEGNGTPVLFDRNFASAQHMFPVTSKDIKLLPWQINKYAEETIESPKWSKNCSKEFTASLLSYVKTQISGKLLNIREAHDMMSGEHDPGEEYDDLDIDIGTSELIKKLVNTKLTVTKRQMERFMGVCWDKFMKAKIEPASAVGAVGAQSIGEPGTQMTLKTFHFAGVASMNITLGVPRIKEIINAAKVITTPIITTRLVNNYDVKAARIVKGRIEKTMLGDIAEFIEEVYKPDECYIGIRLDMDAIRRLQLETDLDEVANAIGLAPKLKIGTNNVQCHKPDRLRIYVQSKDPAGLYFSIKQLKRALPEIIVKGLPQVNRAVINEIQGGSKQKELLVEGYGLRELMNTEGVVGTQTRSNHVMEVWKVLGIEAARRTILDEIKSVMDSHGLTIDPRHVMLLGDIMTSKGEVLGITRFGIAKMKDSVMMLASFEKTTDHLFEAALYSKKDAIEGVSECIIMGIPMSIGTGLFKLIKKDSAHDRIPTRRRLLFDP